MDSREIHERYVPKLFPGSSHIWALERLANLPSDSAVLDIGPGSGLMGEELKNRGLSNICAVEIDPGARENLKVLYSKVYETIEPLRDQKFDLILLLDVLEHLTNPFEFFEQVVALLAPRGRILVSVPNVAHWSVRIPLLFGFFEYTGRAILDRTHYQFFNKRRFQKLIKSTDTLQTLKFGVTIEPAELALPKLVWDNLLFRFLAKIRIIIAYCLPGLMGYQFIAYLERP